MGLTAKSKDKPFWLRSEWQASTQGISKSALTQQQSMLSVKGKNEENITVLQFLYTDSLSKDFNAF